MAKQEENSAIVFANRKKTAVTDPGHILQNVARIPHTFQASSYWMRVYKKRLHMQLQQMLIWGEAD